jgi:hypothetical protein
MFSFACWTNSMTPYDKCIYLLLEIPFFGSSYIYMRSLKLVRAFAIEQFVFSLFNLKSRVLYCLLFSKRGLNAVPSSNGVLPNVLKFIFQLNICVVFIAVARIHSDLSGKFLFQQVRFQFLNCAISGMNFSTALATALYCVTHKIAHSPEHFASRVVSIYLMCFSPCSSFSKFRHI